MWLAFSALGSVMLLASTSHITQNIASVPFLWVLPLSLYLLTFVLAFEGRGGRGWYERWMMFVTLLFVVGMAAGLSAGRGVLDVSLAVPLYSVGMFVSVFFCNGELALRKPAPRYLTQFYLTISLGGALGGLFVGLLAPRLFPTTFELPLALMALAAMGLVVVWNNKFLIGPALVASLATAWYGSEYLTFLRDDVIYMHRNFYGTLRVREQGTGDLQVRRLLHGVILHGEQSTTAPDRLEPGTYYARTSGVGRAIEARQSAGPVRLGVVGLGVGTLSAYGRAGDTVRFYELDPDVLALAKNYFSYLPSSPSNLEFVIGDARLSLERELARGAKQGYDVLAIDAFSSDSIPVHLITREAIDLFMQHVAPDGILAIHISNRFLDLKPVLANIAQSLGLEARLVSDSPTGSGSASITDWVLIARTDAPFAHELLDVATPVEPNPSFSLWTDQFNNLLDVLKSSPLEEFRRLVGLVLNACTARPNQRSSSQPNANLHHVVHAHHAHHRQELEDPRARRVCRAQAEGRRESHRVPGRAHHLEGGRSPAAFRSRRSAPHLLLLAVRRQDRDRRRLARQRRALDQPLVRSELRNRRDRRRPGVHPGAAGHQARRGAELRLRARDRRADHADA